MLVEINSANETHWEHSARIKVHQACSKRDMMPGGYCINCGWTRFTLEDRDYLDRRKEPCDPKS